MIEKLKKDKIKTMLEIKNLNLTLDNKKILKDINLEIPQSGIYSFVGPNGAGKSTLAYTIMGLTKYQKIEGDIIFNKESIKGTSISQRAKKGITLAWQEPARYEGLTVKKFISFSLKKKNEKIIKESLLKVGLDPSHYLNRFLDRTLSGGERKRIEFASILAMNPKLVLLDEIDSGVDIASFGKIIEGINWLKKNGSTIILITHSPEIMEQSEKAFLICGGKLVLQGKSKEIYNYFKNECLNCRHKNNPTI